MEGGVRKGGGMRTFQHVTALFGLLIAFSLSGCGLIGGAFTLPEDETRAAGRTESSADGTPEMLPNAATPLPLQSVTALPTGMPQLPAGCVDALSVQYEDYGKTMCVGGVVTLITMQSGVYRVYFGPRGSLYMMGTEWVDRIGLRKGECAYAEGKLSRDTNSASPVMPITPYTLKRCPVAQPAAAPARPADLPADCAYALEVTPDDVGLKKCIGGTVSFSEWVGDEYRIYFYSDRSLGLHLVSSQWTGRGVNAGDCIYIAGEIIGLDGSTGTPVLHIVPGNVTYCPA
jgi:hypothetical protein